MTREPKSSSRRLTRRIRASHGVILYAATGSNTTPCDFDEAVAKWDFALMQTELVDRCRTWDSRTQFANAMFEWFEVFCDRELRLSTLDYKTPVAYDTHRPVAPPVRTRQPNPGCLLNGGNSNRLKRRPLRAGRRPVEERSAQRRADRRARGERGAS